MTLQNPFLSRGDGSTQYNILENDNLVLATKSANTSVDNAVQMRDSSFQQDSVFERHVFSLTIAYNEADQLAKSLGISQEIAVHAKSLYTQVYNYSDFYEHDFQPDTLTAACVYIACREKNQPRTMPEVFKLTHATTQSMLTECEALKAFLAVPLETHNLLSKANKRLQSAYGEIDTLSTSNRIPLHASHHAKCLYKQIYLSESFVDQDHGPVVTSCLLIACRQLNIPQTFAIDTGNTKDHIARTLRSLELFYKAKEVQKTKATSAIHESVTSTATDASSIDHTIHTIQEMIEHLDLESDTSTTNQQNANIRASFAPTAPTPASIATSKDDDTNPDISMAPSAPFTSENVYPSSDNDSIISTFPPIKPATNSNKNARATRKTLYNVICCQCKKILNLQNIHYTFQCVSCKHKRCDKCTMEAIK